MKGKLEDLLKIWKKNLSLGDFEEEKKRVHGFSKNASIYFCQNTLKLALISPFGFKDPIVKALTMDHCKTRHLGQSS